MEPLTIGLIAGGAYLLSKGAGAGGVSTSAVATMSIDQLAAMFVGKPFESTPLEVRRRFQQEAVRVRATNKAGVIVWPMSAAENASLPADWAYLLGRVPDFSRGDLGDGTNPWGPGAVWRRIRIKAKESAWSNVVGIIAPIVGTVVAGPAGTAAGAAAGKALSGFAEFAAVVQEQASPQEPAIPPLTLDTANPVARVEAGLAKAAGYVGAPPPGRTGALVTGVAVGYLLRGILGAAIGFALASWASKKKSSSGGAPTA